MIEASDGGRFLPAPSEDTVHVKLSQLAGGVEGRTLNSSIPVKFGTLEGEDGAIHEVWPSDQSEPQQSTKPETLLPTTVQASRTHPRFPPLPISSLSRDVQCLAFRVSSFLLSLCFLGVIVLGSLFTWLPVVVRNLGLRMLCQDPKTKRPFSDEERPHNEARRQANKEWQ